MELFKLNEDFLVDINKEWIQLHEAFKKIYLRDKGNNSNHYKGRFKFQAQKEFTYIYLLCDYRSNLVQYSEEEREEQSRKDAGLESSWKPDKEIKDAIERYRELQQTRPLKLLQAAHKKIDNMIRLLNEEQDEMAIEDITNNIKAMKDIAGLLKTIGELENMTKKELSETGNGRGNVELGENEL